MAGNQKLKKCERESTKGTNVIRGGFTKKGVSRQAGAKKRGLSGQGRELREDRQKERVGHGVAWAGTSRTEPQALGLVCKWR